MWKSSGFSNKTNPTLKSRSPKKLTQTRINLSKLRRKYFLRDFASRCHLCGVSAYTATLRASACKGRQFLQECYRAIHWAPETRNQFRVGDTRKILFGKYFRAEGLDFTDKLWKRITIRIMLEIKLSKAHNKRKVFRWPVLSWKSDSYWRS